MGIYKPAASHSDQAAITQAWNRWVKRSVLSLLYPSSCLLCSSPTRWPEILCDRCQQELPSLEGPRCSRCQQQLESTDLDLCDRCGGSEWWFTTARALGPYDSGWGQLVRSLKFEKERAVVEFLVQKLVTYASGNDSLRSTDLVTFVPMDRQSIRKRGFNQARLLALGLGKGLNIPVRKCLKKITKTKLQAGLHARERRANLRGAFQLLGVGKDRVLLVDDIYTTGSTAQECSRTLVEGGYNSVSVLTVARA